MDLKKTMRIGFCPFYPIPKDVVDDKKAEWTVIRSAELGCTATQIPFMPRDPNAQKALGELAVAKNVELEAYAMGVFDLVGPNAKDGLAKFLGGIADAKQVGAKIIRTGYGHLNIETSRFNKKVPLAQHLDKLVQNLKAAAPIVADNGLLLAIENHCDFTGKEMAQIFSAVGSPVVGCALDTANGFTVYCDPNDDVQDLARYSITTHLKDMVMVDDFKAPSLIPMIPVGCAVGEGHVDIPRAIKALAEQSPWANGLHLIIELGWERYPEGANRDDLRREMFHKSIDYLKAQIA
jgi:3-oxoisoapionate decarboxylase